MVELTLSFDGYSSFENCIRKEGHLIRSKVREIIDAVALNGVTEPISGKRYGGQEIVIDRERPQVSMVAGKFNCRSRADMMAIELGLQMLSPPVRRKPKILGAEGITPLSMLLRTLSPYYLPTEYLPTEEEKKAHFPIQHLDLMDINFGAPSFDVFFSAHVLEHVPDISRAIQQIANALVPGGVLVSTFPFDPERRETLTKARLNADNEIEYLTEPEYHKNPVQHNEGSLVFQLPGWDVLEMCRDSGLKEATFVMFASSAHGVMGRKNLGVFALLARKPLKDEAPIKSTIRQKREW